MINYKFQDNIFKVEFKGDINLTEIIEYLKEFAEIKDLPNNLKLLYDLSTVDFELEADPDDIELISVAANESTKMYNTIKTAIFVKSPKVTAYSTLFTEFGNNKKTTRNIFSTKEAAIKWLYGI